jgi:Double-GTPase 2
MSSGTGSQAAGLVVSAVFLVVIVVSARYGVSIFVQYTRALVSSYGFGKEPKIADLVRQPVRQPKDDHEPAYDRYLVAQAWRDLRHAQVRGLHAYRDTLKKSWQSIVDKRFRPKLIENVAPQQQRKPRRITGSAAVCCLGLGVFVAALLVVMAGLVQAVVLAVLAGIAWVLLYVLQALDIAVLQARGVTNTCKNCGHRLFSVTYACDKCDARHKKLRPGRYGMIHRICSCGNRLPTLALNKKYRLAAWCTNCDRPLTRQTGGSAEIVLPVFGGPQVGKTQLVNVLLLALERLVQRTSGTFEYADEPTQVQVEKIRKGLDQHRIEQTLRISAVTGTAVHPAYSLHVKPSTGSAKLLHVFDAAGESFRSASTIEQLSYLKLARTMVFVMDPLSIDTLWDGFDDAEQQQLTSRRAEDEPHVVFTETLQTVTSMGINTSKLRLAVVVSKADLVAEKTRMIGHDDQSVRGWLSSLGQGHMIRAMDHHFGRVQFFLTAATTDAHQQPDVSVEAFTRDVLAAEGLRLSSTSK